MFRANIVSQNRGISFFCLLSHSGYLLHAVDQIQYAMYFSSNCSQNSQTRCEIPLEMPNLGYSLEYHLRHLFWPQIPDIHLQLIRLP